MKLSLYNIEKNYIDLTEKIIEDEGILTEETEKQLAISEQQLQVKGACYAFIVKNLEDDISIIESEIKRLQALKSSRVKTADRLKETLSNAMKLFGISEIKTPLIKINFRKSESVIVNELAIPEKFLIKKTTATPDKIAISKAIKLGEKVEGAYIQENFNLQIK